MVEFEQIIGRGTHVHDDYGKLLFNILDYTGTATRTSPDPAFDGDPAFATQEEIDEQGKAKSVEIHLRESADTLRQPGRIARPLGRCHPTRRPHPRTRRAQNSGRCNLHLRDRRRAAEPTGRRPARPALPSRLRPRSHPPPAHRPRETAASRLQLFKPEAQEILSDLLEKYVNHGVLQFTLSDVLKVPPISQRGNVNEIIGKFGGADQLRTAVNQLQSLLYAA